MAGNLAELGHVGIGASAAGDPAPSPAWVRVLGTGALKLDFGHGVVTNAEGLVLASARFETQLETRIESRVESRDVRQSLPRTETSGERPCGEVVQLDARGRERWRVRIVEAERQRAPSVAMDDGGSAYLLGMFVPARVPHVGAVLAGAEHLGLVKLHSDGRPAWWVGLGRVPLVDGRPCPPAARVAADPLGGASVVIAEREGIRLVRVTEKGGVMWDRTFAMRGTYDPGVGVDASGATAIWSCFQGSAQLDDHRLASAGPARFVARIHVDGRVHWAHVLSTLQTADYAMALDRDGGIALAGIVRPKHGETAHVGAHDLVVARFDKDGEAAARTRFPGRAHTSASVCIATTGRGGVALAGYVSGALSIAGRQVGSATGASEAVFLARVGNAKQWARAVEGPQLQAGLSVHGDASGGVTVAGWFAGSGMDFGRATLEASEQAAFFVARYAG